MSDPTLSSRADQDQPDPEKSDPRPRDEGQESKPPANRSEKNDPAKPGSTSKSESETEGNRSSDPVMIVRYGLMNKIGEFRNKPRVACRPGMPVVVRTERGVELGEVVCGINGNGTDSDDESNRLIAEQHYREYLRNYENKHTLRRGGKVLRAANEQDLIDFRHLRNTADEAAQYCRDTIRQLKLPMSLVKVEHLLGGEKIIFHFTAQSRVDFRKLVKQLASRFRTRIEMHQVGARDEARLVADYEKCGRRCCCKTFLKELKPISMKMAKIQKATLDPSKISGRCGRLMCCLRYEDDVYSELRKNLPSRNTWIRTEQGISKVVDTQIITQLVRIQKPGGATEVIGVEDIVERNVRDPGRSNGSKDSDDATGDNRDRTGGGKKAPAAEKQEKSEQTKGEAGGERSATGGQSRSRKGRGNRGRPKKGRGRRKRRGRGQKK